MKTESLKRRRYASKEEAVNDHKRNYRTRGSAKGKFNVDGPDGIRIIRIAEPIPEGGTVLDCGCNDGGLGLLFQRRKGCVVYGVDVVEELVEAANMKGVLARCSAIEDIPFKDEMFDAVVCGETLEHLYDPDEGLRQIHRVLKPDGVFTGSVPHPDGGLGKKHPTGGDYHQSIFETDELRELLEKYFESVEIRGTPYIPQFCRENNIPEDFFQWLNWICKNKKA